MSEIDVQKQKRLQKLHELKQRRESQKLQQVEEPSTQHLIQLDKPRDSVSHQVQLSVVDLKPIQKQLDALHEDSQQDSHPIPANEGSGLRSSQPQNIETVLAEKEELVRTAQQEARQLKIQLIQKSKLIEDRERTIKRHEFETQQLTQANSRLQATLDLRTIGTDQHYKNELGASQIEMKKLNDQFQKDAEQQQQVINDLKQQLVEYQTELQGAKLQPIIVQNADQKFKIKIKQLEAEQDELRAKFAAQLHELAQRDAELSGLKNQLGESTHEKSAIADEASAINRQLQQQLLQTEQQLTKVNERCQKLQQESATQQMELNLKIEAASDQTNVNKQIGQLQSELQGCRIQHRHECERKNGLIGEQERQIAQLVQEAEQTHRAYESELAETRQRQLSVGAEFVDQLREKLKHSVEESGALQAENLILKQQLGQLQTNHLLLQQELRQKQAEIQQQILKNNELNLQIKTSSPLKRSSSGIFDNQIDEKLNKSVAENERLQTQNERLAGLLNAAKIELSNQSFRSMNPGFENQRQRISESEVQILMETVKLQKQEIKMLTEKDDEADKIQVQLRETRQKVKYLEESQGAERLQQLGAQNQRLLICLNQKKSEERAEFEEQLQAMTRKLESLERAKLEADSLKLELLQQKEKYDRLVKYAATRGK